MKDLVEYVVKSLVESPDEVSVEEIDDAADVDEEE